MKNEFEGKSVLLSGGTSGIGRATALAFAARGARVVITGRNESQGAEVAAEAAALSGEIHFLACDVLEPEQIETVSRTAVDWLGGLDIALNNAGHQEKRAALIDQPLEVFERVFDVNVRAIHVAMRTQIRTMLEAGGGVIVNIASVSGIRNPNPGFAVYSASKAAMISLTKSAAMEYGPQGIRINAVAPGRVDTPMLRASKVADMAAVAAGLPLRRLGQPEEVAEAILWLASDRASFVAGHVLSADGGFLAQ
ncbi:SDR family NAD(P)-dependent oxidoreductase [Denitrobaculum tricleocarpae]|uniref:Glucose 1-dehydrogenase n=1 Tax=Denitrobaculum tricleocarpae TaxID=2591009 RepID=A0A545TUS7_9PROT|nr:glucose 1-dehydrogenase [Denitrobaculum tricleocarpae]TQV80911.1 glucose 1-dehydrogenase [Denitrobaculum tricleocarpae]